MIFHTLFSWSYFWVSKCLRISQVIGFDLQNLWKTPVEEWHFASKNQLPGFNIGGALVENGLKPQKIPVQSSAYVHFILFWSDKLIRKMHWFKAIFILPDRVTNLKEMTVLGWKFLCNQGKIELIWKCERQ